MGKRSREFENALIDYDDRKCAFNLVERYTRVSDELHEEYLEGIAIIIDNTDEIIEMTREIERRGGADDDIYDGVTNVLKCAAIQMEEAIGSLFSFITHDDTLDAREIRTRCGEISVVLMAIICTNMSLRAYLNKH